jgi:hypothetical protein
MPLTPFDLVISAIITAAFISFAISAIRKSTKAAGISLAAFLLGVLSSYLLG